MLVAVVFCCVLAAVSGCSTDLPWYARAPSLTANQVDMVRIKFSTHVLFGRAVKKVRGGEYPYNNVDGVFTIEFNVLCSYKGGAVPPTVYIAGMGELTSIAYWVHTSRPPRTRNK